MSKRFSEQFKSNAVALVGKGTSINAVSKQLGIGCSTLDKWVRAKRITAGELEGVNQEQKRLRELERQVAHLQEVNEVLKKATVYFANHPNR